LRPLALSASQGPFQPLVNALNMCDMHFKLSNAVIFAVQPEVMDLNSLTKDSRRFSGLEDTTMPVHEMGLSVCWKPGWRGECPLLLCNGRLRQLWLNEHCFKTIDKALSQQVVGMSDNRPMSREWALAQWNYEALTSKYRSEGV
jgi:hypothetical protein